jgi:DNA-binding transcriptional MerR regulator
MSGERRDLDEDRRWARSADTRANGEFTLGELTDAAGVSVRTVRYYIAEGLLPPPKGAGPSSIYTSGHLDRLRLIQRLKAAYFPLKEIRRRLAGLADEEVGALLDVDATAADLTPEHPLDASLAGAREYLALLESPERYRAEPLALFAPPLEASGMTPAAPASAHYAADYAVQNDEAPEQWTARPRAQPEREREPPLWRRLRLGDEAELVISDRVYARHRERVDWLVRWARKVFD